MNQTGHVTRTLYIPPENPDLLTSSNDNVDPGTADVGSGRSQLRVFHIADLVSGKHAVDYTDGDAGEMLMWNSDNSDCEKHCFRRAGLLLDKQARLFMTSDATGDWFLVMGTQNKGVTANP